ncbi:hypothetical protein MASR2M15_03090 [Anaerolineales bacterium]
MTPPTRGSLKRAKITNLSNKEVVNCMFNPYEYSISKTNSWTEKGVIGQNIPDITFSKGGAKSLNLTLHFDTQTQKKDVRKVTSPLWKMTLIDDSKKDQVTQKGEPPTVAFEWGALYFKAIITSLTEKYTLFDESGTPLRSEISINLQQFQDETQMPAQVPGLDQGAAPNVIKIVEGTRMDHIAASSGQSQRAVAEKNNIDNPLNMPNGKNMVV